SAQSGVERAACAPNHVSERKINHGHPKSCEKEHCAEFHAFGKCAGNQGGCDNRKHQLKQHECLLRNARTYLWIRFASDPTKKSVAKSTKKSVAERERKAIAEKDQNHTDQRHKNETLHHRAQDFLLTHQTAVEESQSWSRHHEHQSRRHQYPGIVAGRLGCNCCRFDFCEATLKRCARVLGRSVNCKECYCRDCGKVS